MTCPENYPYGLNSAAKAMIKVITPPGYEDRPGIVRLRNKDNPNLGNFHFVRKGQYLGAICGDNANVVVLNKKANNPTERYEEGFNITVEPLTGGSRKKRRSSTKKMKSTKKPKKKEIY